MRVPWYETIGLAMKMPDAKFSGTLLIPAFHFYEEYNDIFDKISSLDMTLIPEEEKSFEVILKFVNVSSLHLTGFGNAYNQLLGFHITDLKEYRVEKERRYLIEDYEDDSVSFYCERIEILNEATEN